MFFNIVGVAGAVYVGVVAVWGFVLYVSGGDCDTPRFFLGSFVDFVEVNS
jgi:uncharacterized iron-regulated membrane protein